MSGALLRSEAIKVITLPGTWVVTVVAWGLAFVLAFATARSAPEVGVAQALSQIAAYPVAAACAAFGAVMGAHEYLRQWCTTLLATPRRGYAFVGRVAVRLAFAAAFGVGTAAVVLAGWFLAGGNGGDAGRLVVLGAFFTVVAEVIRNQVSAAVMVLLALWVPIVLRGPVPWLTPWLPAEPANVWLTEHAIDARETAVVVGWVLLALAAAALAQRRDA